MQADWGRMPPSSGQPCKAERVSEMFGTKKIFSFQDSVAVDVRDVATAQRWYKEKMGLPYFSTDVEEADMVLGYSAEDANLSLVKCTGSNRPDSVPGHPPIIFAKKLATAHEYLSARGVNVGPIQQDSGGNHFFRFRDLDGNELEVCQE
jgi:catechol 2,3-dioxygenase-like lactoylglutathione lyase family enzyme